ncbi:hypothetical protein AVEN_127916-1 [Araneus ventricosus]|uniref:Secreted protein n=1 Tax=Araneus ventricosus TaxID=182803 RepID=A0A4Y1ZZD7_ARAVE|nr:hypothetical protein AVEN_127916-1 [Araneus ventricosus]
MSKRTNVVFHVTVALTFCLVVQTNKLDAPAGGGTMFPKGRRLFFTRCSVGAAEREETASGNENTQVRRGAVKALGYCYSQIRAKGNWETRVVVLVMDF